MTLRKEKSFDAFVHKLLKVPTAKAKSLASFLPEESNLAFLDQMGIIQGEKSYSLDELFGKIDLSWYLPYLNGLPPKDYAFFVSALPMTVQETIGWGGYHFSEKYRKFILNLLFKNVFESDIPLPLSYLESDPLIPIAKADKVNLDLLIFYLGLFDVTFELKKTIRGSVFRGLEEILSKEELEFLKTADQIHPKIYFGDLGLAHWDGDGVVFRKTIYERGLNRLAKAFSLSEIDLVWYVSHTLDTINAKHFQSLMVTTKETEILSTLAMQVLETWEKLCTAFHL